MTVVRKNFNEELERIRSQIKKMGETTAAFVTAAVDCLVTLDAGTAKEVRKCEKEIDTL